MATLSGKRHEYFYVTDANIKFLVTEYVRNSYKRERLISFIATAKPPEPIWPNTFLPTAHHEGVLVAVRFDPELCVHPKWG